MIRIVKGVQWRKGHLANIYSKRKQCANNVRENCAGEFRGCAKNENCANNAQIMCKQCAAKLCKQCAAHFLHFSSAHCLHIICTFFRFLHHPEFGCTFLKNCANNVLTRCAEDVPHIVCTISPHIVCTFFNFLHNPKLRLHTFHAHCFHLAFREEGGGIPPFSSMRAR